MGQNEVRERHGTSIWPFILIGIGVVWLLGEANIISAANLSVLWRLWPVILIAIGLELLVGRGSRMLGTLIGAGAVVLVIVLMIVGPSLGLAKNAEVKSAQYSEPVNGATSAKVTVGVSTGDLTIHAAADSADLLKADVRYFGTLTYNTSGTTERAITLKDESNSGFNFNFFDALFQSEALRWDVALNSGVPLDLEASNGTGSTHIDLTGFQLSALNLSSGTGSVEVALPSSQTSYSGYISTGTGSLNLTIPDGAAVSLTVSTGTGSANLDLPDGAAVQLVASTGTGSVNVPSFLKRTTQPSQGVGQNGTWQSDNFEGADQRIVINYSGGTGSLNVR